MFQKFTSSSNPEKGGERLAALRKEMRKEKLTHFLIPHADEHQNEYLPERAERLSWLTGFLGSAGFCIAGLKQAIVFVDGRYTLQLREQTDLNHFTPESLVDLPPSKWLAANTTRKSRIGFDPALTTIAQYEQFSASVKQRGAELAATDNLIDRIWHDQPASPAGLVKLHANKYAGQTAAKKITSIQKAIADKQADLCLLTDPASLCWLFNIRGNDMVHNPLVLGYAIIPAKGKPTLFIEPAKLTASSEKQLKKLANLAAPKTVEKTLAKAAKGKQVLCDPNLVAWKFAHSITKAGGKIIKGRDPVVLPRAIKNQTEIQGARNAHIRDGVAMCKFLYWLDQQRAGSIDEITTAKKLESIRFENAKAMGSRLEEISFDTISGAGPNGAIVHYRVSEKTNARIKNNSLYLVDSGAQYLDGTTDITRTIAIGKPPKQAITDYTLVLKGHIAIGLARFPKGTRGVDLDVLARNALWQNGKDYAHGTGHGVGSFMNVHEGPQSLSKRGMEPFVPGMIVSNEPGYYVEGKYGIRIENLVLVTESESLGGNIDTHGFENLTFAPIDLRLIDTSLLNSVERKWLNDYHAQTYKKLSPHLPRAEKTWLKQATRKI